MQYEGDKIDFLKNELLIASFLLSASPGLAMYLFGPTSLVQILGLVVILLAFLMIPFGLLTRGGVTKFGWIVLGLVLFVLVLASGYIPLAAGFSIGFNPGLTEIVSLSVLLLEIGIVFSTLFGNYKTYASDLKKAGYDEEEFRFELGSFDRFLILLMLASLGISLGIYFLFSAVPAIGIDALTGLVIVAIIYFVIARYVLSQRKIQTKGSLDK